MPTPVAAAQLRQVIESNTDRVFRTMLQVPIAAMPSRSWEPAANTTSVVSLIGLTGRWTGSGSVSCSGRLARVLSGKLLMTEFADVDADVLDAMGEIANMIIGNVKEDIAATLGPLGISTPTVIHGTGLQSRTLQGEASSTVVFACEGEFLEVRVSLAPAGRG